MELKQRKSVRDEREQLVTLVNGWDPAGRLAAGAPRHAYESFVDKLLALLRREENVQEVAAFLESEVASQFGVAPRQTGQFANKAVNWFRIAAGE